MNLLNFYEAYVILRLAEPLKKHVSANCNTIETWQLLTSLLIILSASKNPDLLLPREKGGSQSQAGSGLSPTSQAVHTTFLLPSPLCANYLTMKTSECDMFGNG